MVKKLSSTKVCERVGVRGVNPRVIDRDGRRGSARELGERDLPIAVRVGARERLEDEGRDFPTEPCCSWNSASPWATMRSVWAEPPDRERRSSQLTPRLRRRVHAKRLVSPPRVACPFRNMLAGPGGAEAASGHGAHEGGIGGRNALAEERIGRGWAEVEGQKAGADAVQLGDLLRAGDGKIEEPHVSRRNRPAG